MTPEYTNQVTVGLLLLILCSVLSIGMLITLAIIRHIDYKRRSRCVEESDSDKSGAEAVPTPASMLFNGVTRWLTVRSSNPGAVQEVLGLHNAKPFRWSDGPAQLGDQTLFISPAVEGWLFIFGPGVPDPSHDVDASFRFIMKLGRELGHVQFFSHDRALDYHAWVRVDGDRVIRAYAWAGETVWNQGKVSAAESAVGMRCFEYGEEFDFTSSSAIAANAENVPALAARWSLDPSKLDVRRLASAQGIAGELLQFH